MYSILNNVIHFFYLAAAIRILAIWSPRVNLLHLIYMLSFNSGVYVAHGVGTHHYKKDRCSGSAKGHGGYD